MTGGSPTSGADPPPIRCSIRSVIRTFWRARARLHAPDADDAAGGRRYSAARYGEKRGGAKRPPLFSIRCAVAAVVVTLRSAAVAVVTVPLSVAPSLPCGRRLHCRSGGRCPSRGRTAAVGSAACSGCRVACAACSAAAVAAAPPRANSLSIPPACGCVRQTPQEARVAGDPTRISGWRGSVGPGASGAVLGVRAGGRRRRCPATDRRRSA